MPSSDDMESRGLRIKRSSGNLQYLHNNVEITKAEWDQIMSEPPPNAE